MSNAAGNPNEILASISLLNLPAAVAAPHGQLDIQNIAGTLKQVDDAGTATSLGGGGGGVASVTGISAGIVDNTDPLNPKILAQFGSDTSVSLQNASSQPVKALELVNTLTTSTAGSEVSRWVMKLLNAGAQVTALQLDPTVLTLGGTLKVGSNGSAAAPSLVASSTEPTGLFRSFASTLGFSINGTNTLNLTGLGFFPGATNFIYSLDNASGAVGMKLQGSNATLYSAADVQIGVDGALATNATVGFLDIPSCAGTPTGTPTPRTGKVPLIGDTTAGKLWMYYGGAWHFATFT